MKEDLCEKQWGENAWVGMEGAVEEQKWGCEEKYANDGCAGRE